MLLMTLLEQPNLILNGKIPEPVSDVLMDLVRNGMARRNEPLAKHTTMRVGGPAAWWAEPKNEDELRAVLRAVREADVPLQPLGAGSNLIASDDGFDGLVFKLGKGFEWHRVEGRRLIAGGAAMLPKLTHVANQNLLGNFEWACGVPGMVGGSIWGNAGARGFNGETLESRDIAADLESLVAFDRDGNRHVLRRDEIEFSYRRSSLNGLIVTEATFALRPLTPEQARAHKEAIGQLLKIRRETQPANAASAGCIWKNPRIEGGPLAGCRGAGELIEKLGLKGHSSGQAAISEVHANFIVNLGGATAEDVRALISSVEEIAWREAGVHLEREARLLD